MTDIAADGQLVGAAPLTLKPSLRRYGAKIADAIAARPFVVFLCGPFLKGEDKPGTRLRRRLLDALTEADFEVVLGEDEGLEEPRLNHGFDAHLNEVMFVEQECDAIVLVAASVGSFCELGVFSYLKPHKFDHVDMILLADQKFQGDRSYFNLGPASAVEGFGKVFYCDFDRFDVDLVVSRLKQRRAVLALK